jgi:ribose 5-phosphate isomerase RpiB
MVGESQIREIVRRVSGRVMAERGRASYPAGREEKSGARRAGGVHVDIRHVHPESSGSPGRNCANPLVTAPCLADMERGDVLRLPPGAIVTDSAREEAWHRGIVLVGETASPASTRSDGRLRVALGADRGGFALKQAAIGWVRELGHLPIDLGARDERPVDHHDFARAVAEAVAQGRADVGICFDGARTGSALMANKVLTLGSRSIPARSAVEIVRSFLSTPSKGME